MVINWLIMNRSLKEKTLFFSFDTRARIKRVGYYMRGYGNRIVYNRLTPCELDD